MVEYLRVFRGEGESVDGEAAATALVAWWTPILVRSARPVLRHLRDADDAAADVAQMTAWRALRAADGCRADCDAALLAWVLRIGRRVALDQIAHQCGIGAGVPLEEVDESATTLMWSTDASPSHEHLLSAVLERLPPAQAAVLRARAHEGLTWPALGRQLGTTASAARRRYDRAVDAARRLVKDRAPQPEVAQQPRSGASRVR